MSKRKSESIESGKSFRKKIDSMSSNDSTDSENRSMSERNISKKNPSYSDDGEAEAFVPSLNLGLGKLNLGAINNPKNMYNDDGYETDDTVLEEDYAPPTDWTPPKSGYQKYLEDRKKNLEQYDSGYETDDTVILDENGNYIKGGRKRLRFMNKKSHKKNKLYKTKKYIFRRKNTYKKRKNTYKKRKK
jgi:hypothetical protein